MMCANAHRCCPLEAFITVVAWLVDFMDERRCDTILSNSIGSMAGSTLGLICQLTNLCTLRKCIGKSDLSQSCAITAGS